MTYLEIHYVYGHFRNDTNKIFYVGKGSGKRAWSRNGRNAYWKSIVNKANGYSVKLIASNLSVKEAYNFERLLVTKLKLDSKVNLANLNDGGEGGLNPSKETREKQRNAKVGKPLSEEHRINIGKSLKGKSRPTPWLHTPENIAKRIQTVTGTKRAEGVGANISKAKKAQNFHHSQETKNKISATKAANKIIKYLESFK